MPHEGAPVLLQVLPALVSGGVERGTVEITQAVAETGWTALVTSAGGPMVSAVQRAGGRHIVLPLDTKNPVTIWRNAARLAALIRQERVCIVHARSRAPAWSAWLACRRTGAHFITTYHGAYGENFPFKRRYNAIMARGEIVIAASRFIAELIVRRHGVYPTRIRVIPRGVDPALFDPAHVPAQRIDALARQWGLRRDQPIVMLPGRVTWWKGHSVLLDALARMARRDVQCVFVGRTAERETARLVRQARRLGVTDRLAIVGHCEDVPTALMLALATAYRNVTVPGGARWFRCDRKMAVRLAVAGVATLAAHKVFTQVFVQFG